MVYLMSPYSNVDYVLYAKSSSFSKLKVFAFCYLQHHDTQNTLLKAAPLLSRNKEKTAGSPQHPLKDVLGSQEVRTSPFCFHINFLCM